MSVNTSTGAVDGVTIGVNECDKEGRWRGLPHDLPLPLEYFVYADKKLSFISLAKTISEVSKKGAAYKLLRNNCYWFAYTVMKVWGSVHKESKKVVAYNLGGSGQTLEDLWSYGKALWYNNTFKKDAKEFDDLRRSGFVMAELPLSRERTSPVEHITTLKNVVELYLENASEKVNKQEETQGGLRWTEEFDENVRELEENIGREMSDKEKNDMYEKIEQMVLNSVGKLSMYRQFECMSLQKDDLQAPDSSGITSKQLGLNEPQARQHYLVEELLDRFAATVVAEMDNDSD
ncbi:hypothetical protein ACMYSQ_006261 [Aspergillus niger]